MKQFQTLRRLALSLNALVLVCALLMWWRSGSAFDGYYRVRYFRHVSPQWYFLQGIESVDGRLMFAQSSSTCLSAADAARGTSSEWDELGMERTDVPSGNITAITAWRTKRVVHYQFGDRSLWNRLGFYDSWQLGYRNPSWMRRVVLPYWSLIAPLVVWPAIAVGGVLRRRARRSIAERRRQRDLCPDCGYDMRATPDRCPECGSAAPAVEGQAGHRGTA
jgi:hypothetical protein